MTARAGTSGRATTPIRSCRTTSTRRSTRSSSRRHRVRQPSPTGSPYGTNPPPSGIEGTGTNGFGGFLTSGEYRNWGFAWTTRRTAYGDTHCLFSQVLPGLAERFRPLPSGYNAVSVYSDESGEANINFVPGLGMYFDNLTAANLNKNGGCDLENVDPIGTAAGRCRRAGIRSSSPRLARWPLIRRTSRCTTSSRRRSPSSPRASTSQQHRLQLGRPDRPDARAGHRRLAARLRAGVLDGR